MVLLAHVIAVYPIAPDVLRLKISDWRGQMQALADVGPWTINLTHKAQTLEPTKPSIFSFNTSDTYSPVEPQPQPQPQHQHTSTSPLTLPTPTEAAVCCTWRGSQFHFLLSRVVHIADGDAREETCTPATTPVTGSGTGTATALSLGKRSREESSSSNGSGNNSACETIHPSPHSAQFRVEAVAEIDPRAAAWALLSSLQARGR